MKKLSLLILGLFLIIGLGVVNAIEVSIDNYYPTPVEAGEYLNVWLKITNRGSVDAENSIIQLKQTYPFSLDPGEPEELRIAKIEADSFIIQKMRIKVDGGATEGENKITFQYSDYEGGEIKEKTTPITIVESQTSFDVVLQELNQDGVYIAIANIGKNPANAVTVRIPTQEEFKTQLVSASIVGNLESGDYTLVGFQILPKTEMKRESSKDEKDLTITPKMNFEDMEQLQVQIDYTDPLGIRRSIIKEISVSPSALSMYNTMGDGAMGFAGRNSKDSSFFSGTWFWISIVLILIMVFKYFRNRRRRKRRR